MPKSTVSVYMNPLPVSPHLGTHTHARSIAMDCSNDWDLQALVRSCGGGGTAAAAACNSGAAPTATRGGYDAPSREAADDASVVVGGGGRVVATAAAGQEFLGQPVAAWRRNLDYLDLVDHELLRMPFSITPSSSRETTSGGAPGQQMIRQPRRQPGRKPGVRTPRAKRRYNTYEYDLSTSISLA